MNIPLMALLLVLLLVVWLFIRHRQSLSAEESKPAQRTNSPKIAYHAVSLKFSSSACEAAKELEGRRFLSSAAPRLPLPECEALECSCRFVHHKDRRTGKDRRSPFGSSGLGGGTGKFDQEQRSRKDRRASDDEDFL